MGSKTIFFYKTQTFFPLFLPSFLTFLSLNLPISLTFLLPALSLFLFLLSFSSRAMIPNLLRTLLSIISVKKKNLCTN